MQTHFKANRTLKQLLVKPKDHNPIDKKSKVSYMYQTGHNTTPDNINIIGREDHGIARTIKESIYIRVNNSVLNRNIDKYNLNHIWDRFLLTTPTFKINGHMHRTCISRHATSIPTNRHLGLTGHVLNSEHAYRTL